MHAKKHLGQNFLTSKQAVRDIVRVAGLDDNSTVLEIGPGKGVLTTALLKVVGNVVAVEKDPELFALLQESFRDEIEVGKLVLINNDILDIHIPDVIRGPYKLIANIPYYITGLLFRTFLESDYQPEQMVLLVQKEVAERVVARDHKESILSLSVKVYGEPSIVSKVPARYFKPQPKVDSAILNIQNISKDIFVETTEKDFFQILKKGFQHKRKLLINNLEELYPRSVLEDCFDRCSVLKNSRAEDMTRESFLCLTKTLHE